LLTELPESGLTVWAMAGAVGNADNRAIAAIEPSRERDNQCK
jgi:hypothetical protein